MHASGVLWWFREDGVGEKGEERVGVEENLDLDSEVAQRGTMTTLQPEKGYVRGGLMVATAWCDTTATIAVLVRKKKH